MRIDDFCAPHPNPLPVDTGRGRNFETASRLPDELMNHSSFIIHHSALMLLCAALASVVSPAQPQQYPTRPIRWIVPLAAGGAMDTIARGVGAKLTDSLGQTVVVDNRGGGGGTIGAELAAGAPPDGYTIIMMSATSVIRPLLYSARYATVRRFSPISQ